MDLDPARGCWPSVADLAARVRRGEVGAGEVTRAVLDRITTLDPGLRAVIALDPAAPARAAASEARVARGSRLPLEGVPVLVKDNIDTAGLATTAGSRRLLTCAPVADADVVTALHRAGAVVVGKTNLSEWGNFRSTTAPEGWSGAGGQTRNPHDTDRSPWGSSSGSAAAVAAGYVPLALGTETDGSVVCPAAVCGVVGLKPAGGELSARGVVPLAPGQDTVGVLTRDVPDAAYALAALRDAAAPERRAPTAGRPLRFGLWSGRRFARADHVELDRVGALLRAAGVATVEVELPFDRDRFDDGVHALVGGFDTALTHYLRGRPGAPADLAAVIRGTRADDDPVDLDLLELAAGVSAAARAEAPARARRARDWARAALADVLARHDLTAVLAPTAPPAWPLGAGDPSPPSTSTIPALARHPVVTVPTGGRDGLPTGVSVLGPTSTATVLQVAACLEAAAGHLLTPRPAGVPAVR